jgi:hypothetical protein
LDEVGLLLFLAAIVAAGFLWRRYARRQPDVPPCPRCQREDTALRIDSDTERLDFQEIVGGFSANVEPVLTLRVTYVCQTCGHRWTRKERRYT